MKINGNRIDAERMRRREETRARIKEKQEDYELDAKKNSGRLERLEDNVYSYDVKKIVKITIGVLIAIAIVLFAFFL